MHSSPPAPAATPFPGCIDAFETLFRLCRASADESTMVLAEPGTRSDNLSFAVAALDRLGIKPTLVTAPAPPIPPGPIIRSTGASTALNHQPQLLEQLQQADLLVDMTVEGLMHAEQTASLLQAGVRIQNIANEHPETLQRLAPLPHDRDHVRAAVAACRGASQMQVTSAAGTDLSVSMGGAATVGVWGWTDRPGTLAHWPGGLVVSFPSAGSVNGTLVMAAGDVNLTFKRYLEAPVIFHLEDDFVTRIEGTGTDAELMRRYLAEFKDPLAYATSHVGWGLNERASYAALAMLDKRDTNGNELRALAGNFLFSTGANEFAGRHTLGHFDLPVMHCDITLDGVPVVAAGVPVTLT